MSSHPGSISDSGAFAQVELSLNEPRVEATNSGPRDWQEAQERINYLYPDPIKVSFIQRLLEIIIASAALLFFVPLLVAVALIIRKDSKGPVIFRQRRVAQGGRPFLFTKFRTLYADARERFPELYSYRYSVNEVDSLCFKLQNDPRVTPAGRWLRKSTLDELPNFWNVITGEMALVGPRPEIPEMLRYYNDEALRKFTVRPGITGLAQSSGRGNLRFLEGIEYDLEYVEKRSFTLDVQILWKTLSGIIRQEGAF